MLTSGNLLFDFFTMSDDEDADSVHERLRTGPRHAPTTLISANWDLMVNVVYGEQGTVMSDADYGLLRPVVMPSTYLIDDKPRVCQHVTCMQASDERGTSASNSRYFAMLRRMLHGRERRRSYHTIYAGLNYYLCGNNSKVQVGAEYETLDLEDGDAAEPPLSGPLTACISRTSTRFINNLRTPA